jgi:hypothetical protein
MNSEPLLQNWSYCLCVDSLLQWTTFGRMTTMIIWHVYMYTETTVSPWQTVGTNVFSSLAMSGLVQWDLIGTQQATSTNILSNNIPCLLIIGLCILLRVYQIIIGITSVRNKVFFGARFYCALLTLHVSALFDGHLHVVCKHKTALITFHYRNIILYFIF